MKKRNYNLEVCHIPQACKDAYSIGEYEYNMLDTYHSIRKSIRSNWVNMSQRCKDAEYKEIVNGCIKCEVTAFNFKEIKKIN